MHLDTIISHTHDSLMKGIEAPTPFRFAQSPSLR